MSSDNKGGPQGEKGLMVLLSTKQQIPLPGGGSAYQQPVLLGSESQQIMQDPGWWGRDQESLVNNRTQRRVPMAGRVTHHSPPHQDVHLTPRTWDYVMLQAKGLWRYIQVVSSQTGDYLGEPNLIAQIFKTWEAFLAAVRDEEKGGRDVKH